jgi:hypothetical protein
MSALILSDPAVLAVDAPDGTPAVADTATGPQLVGTVTANTVTFTGAVGLLVTRVMVGEGPYLDGDTPDTATNDYEWEGAPHASTSTESQLVADPGGVQPDVTWDAAACLPPPADYGRWSDQPATLRWDQIEPAQTWNTYTGA